jgi:thiosulfate reductase cytochrome b subunit
MKEATKRSILRWIHIVFGLTIVGYIYGPPAEVLQYRDNFRFVFVPVIILTGFWLWKGQAVRRLFSKGSAVAAGE